MKKTIFIMLVALFALPLGAGAHGMGMMGWGNDYTAPEMMSYIEDRALGDEVHEEMEGLMSKMMSGELTESEAERMVALMETYPGPYGMMMGRVGMMQGYGSYGDGWGSGMPYGGHMFGSWGYTGWLGMLVMIVWLAVGVLLLVRLARGNVNGNEKKGVE